MIIVLIKEMDDLDTAYDVSKLLGDLGVSFWTLSLLHALGHLERNKVYSLIKTGSDDTSLELLWEDCQRSFKHMGTVVYLFW